MKLSLKSAVALIAVSALPLIAAAPAYSAVNPDLSNITVDCSDGGYGGDFELPIYGDSLTITLLNCQTFNLWDFDETNNATIDNGTLDDFGLLEVDESPEVITVTGAADLEIWDNDDEANGYDIYLEFYEPYEMPNPTGAQLVDSSQTIPVVTGEFIAPGDENEMITLGGIEDCEMIAGSHIYASQDITVNTAGSYTFRVTGVSPISDYLHEWFGVSTPVNDPLVAIYREFNPANASEGVVGCNDDLNNLSFGGHDYSEDIEGNLWNVTQQGDYVEGHYSYFTTDLQPGEYTVLFATFGPVSASMWADGDKGSWTPTAATIYFDIWGPASGLELGHTLADTGVNPTFALWSGLALAGTGVAITVARRRAQRA